MGAKPIWIRRVGDVSVLALVGLATVWLTSVLLARFAPADGSVSRELGDVVFSSAVLEEADPHRADLRAAVELVRQRWSYLEHRQRSGGVDLARREAEAVRMLEEQPGESGFRRALVFLIAGLHDGHAFATPEPYALPGDYRWPFSLVEVAEGLMVDAVAVSTAWAQPPEGLPERGDLLRAVDGRGIEAWLADAEEFVFASTDAARRLRAVERVGRFDTEPERRFEFERPGADTKPSEVAIALPRSFHSIPTPSTPGNDRLHRRLEGDLAYFRPGSFAPPDDEDWSSKPERRDEILAGAYAEIDDIVAELAPARGWILDLRGNPGGTDLLGMFLVDRFIDEPYVYYRLASRLSEGWTEAFESSSGAPPGRARATGPLVVIVDERTFSTADNVAACLEAAHPDVRFVGRPNGAGTGAPRSFTLPRTGSRVGFCSVRVWTPGGEIAEGRSVSLDRRVTWTRDDVLQGRDPDLEAAIELLRD